MDLIRIILASMVILGHTKWLNGPSAIWGDPTSFIFKFTYSGALAVKLFFFISGLVVTNSIFSQKKPLAFIIARIFRIVPALLFLLIITVFVFGPLLTNLKANEYFRNFSTYYYLYRNLIFNTDYVLPGVFRNNIFRETVNGSLWTLAAEVKCYIALLGFFLIFKSEKLIYWNILFVFIFINTIIPLKFSTYILDSDSGYLPLCFAFGSFFAVNSTRIYVNFEMVVGSFLIYFLFSETIYAYLILILASSIAVLYVSSIKMLLNFKPKYDISYGIYLWGFLVQQTLYSTIGHIYCGIHFITALIISMIFAFVSFIFIEKPSMKAGKYLSNKFYNISSSIVTN